MHVLACRGLVDLGRTTSQLLDDELLDASGRTGVRGWTIMKKQQQLHLQSPGDEDQHEPYTRNPTETMDRFAACLGAEDREHGTWNMEPPRINLAPGTHAQQRVLRK
jgi:hypothetical protein